ncbi:hypothetical protein NPIL_204441 [Nephila pilipes]|uniref:Uncharacterized protein n=1 Tax=Nephila pilipes TaxID=299642 RepID=A0A8X6P8V7_NEPPI|nr:hypothetical protein NPIL_204441 [Nephila pilipes]
MLEGKKNKRGGVASKIPVEREKKNLQESIDREEGKPEKRELVFADFPVKDLIREGKVFYRSCSLLIGKSKEKIISPKGFSRFFFIYLLIHSLFSSFPVSSELHLQDLSVFLSRKERLDFWSNLDQLSCTHLRLKGLRGFSDTSQANPLGGMPFLENG